MVARVRFSDAPGGSQRALGGKKEDAMKKLIFRTIEALGVAALLVAPAVYGQMRVDVPFDFQLGEEKMTAGEYVVQPISSGSPVLSISGAQSPVTRTSPIGGGKPAEIGKLVFNRYGDRYFLSQVWFYGRAAGHALAKSNAEREIAQATRSGAGLVAVKAR
jgi:hypothetical protein